MNISQEIIAKVDQGIPPKRIADEYTWHTLSRLTQEALFQEVERRSKTSENPKPLLRTLYTLTLKNDPWATLQVLMYGFQNTDAKQSEGILDSMRKVLHRIRNTLSKSKPEDVDRYMQYLAEYYVLEAHREIDVGHLDKAIKSYENALSRYKAGDPSLSDRIALVKQDLSRLRTIQSRSQSLVPREALESRTLRFQQELSKRAAELQSLRRDIEKGVARRDNLREQCAKFKQEMERYEDQKAKLTQLEADIVQHEAGLQFLTVLPRAAIAPLWVEVVRLALAQGEIDVLTQRAIERLIVPHPEEAIPLLAEIVARTPGSVDIDQETYEACTRHWMGKIAEARRLKEEKGLRAAAETLVEAWETYFDTLGGRG